MLILSSAVCCQMIKLSARFSPAFVKKRFFHLSSLVMKESFEPIIRFDSSKKTSDKFRLKDRVPENYELIYKAPMEWYFKLIYPVAVACAVGTPLAILYRYYEEGKLEMKKELGGVKIVNPMFEIQVFTTVTILIAITVISILFKFPFRVYKHNTKNEYIAMFLSWIPPMMSQFHFKGVTKTHFINPLYKMMEGHHYYLDKRRGFLLVHYFRVPADLYNMMGDEKIRYTKE